MTTDFLITLANGEKQARTVKQAKEIEKRQNLIKFDIEREYWRRRGVEWRIVVAEEIPRDLVENIEWLLPYSDLESTKISEDDSIQIARRLTEEMISSEDSLADITSRYDAELRMEEGTCLNLCKYMIINRQWQVDISKRLSPSKKLVIGRD